MISFILMSVGGVVKSFLPYSLWLELSILPHWHEFSLQSMTSMSVSFPAPCFFFSVSFHISVFAVSLHTVQFPHFFVLLFISFIYFH